MNFRKINFITLLIIISISAQSQMWKNSKVKVVAHRADWRNAPENSMQAIKSCIDMGVDMVEIDVQKTKDGTFILMHDKTLDRTTTGKGLIKDMSLDSIQKLFLINAYGVPTQYKIPTLNEVLELCKNKVLIFIDKGYDHLPKLVNLAESYGMTNQVFFEGKMSVQQIKTIYSDILSKCNYMPRIDLKGKMIDEYVFPFLTINSNSIFVFTINEINDSVKSELSRLKKAGGDIMLTTLWAETCGGCTDDEALVDPDSNWGKAIELGADYICTDRPFELIKYLKAKKLH